MGCCSSEMVATAHESEAEVDDAIPVPVLSDMKKGRSLAENLRFGKSSFVQTVKGHVTTYYDMRELLGKGAFGQVFRGVHKSTRLSRAIKSINKESLSKSNRERLLQEVQILKELDHPNILSILEVVEDDNTLHIVTEIYTGGELFDHIVKLKSFTEEAAARYMYQLMSAINHCHKNSITHRDVKPENILLESKSANAFIKLIDFGISKKFADTPLTRKYGTAYYIAPEILEGNYNEKCDIWSCGVILFIFLCGDPPFNGPNSKEIIRKVKTGRFEFSHAIWNNISQHAKDLISRMLTLNPAQRPSAEEVFLDPWVQQTCVFPPEHDITDHLKLLSKFNYSQKFQHAVLTYIAGHFLARKEVEKLRMSFMKLDRNGDGRLSLDEVRSAYNTSFLLGADVEELFQRCDSDGSGFIDYTEFLTGATDWHARLGRTQLETAFKAFDTDRNGKIDKNELKQILSGREIVEEEVWDAVLQEADVNGDGVIDLEEFKHSMLNRSSSLSSRFSLSTATDV